MMRYLMLPLFAVAAIAQQADPFAPLRAFEGKWVGAASGEPGEGISTREYKFELGGRFFIARNQSVYGPKAPAGKPEVHGDLGIFSYDRAAKKLVLRQFHAEGFVNEYVLEDSDGKTLEFVTVKIENIPAAWKAKEVYRIVSADEIEETFSLASPGKDYAVYSRTVLKRSPKN
jgi:hypothetical protein